MYLKRTVKKALALGAERLEVCVYWNKVPS